MADAPETILVNAPLWWPTAREWMWSYCIYLGGYVGENGHKYDLGIYMGGKRGNSMAIVTGPNDGDYLSGPCEEYEGMSAVNAETVKRARALGLLEEV